jgi:alkylation response protein AidB-like acyl-CoA dehydrogenase
VAVIEELCRGGAFAAGPFIHCAFYGGINISENGSEQQKRALLPELARGERLFAYGLSEPDVGGDLASVRTLARRSDDGRRVVVNGFKRWCTGADFADTIYCLVRSEPDGKRYENLSLLLIPTDAPGLTVHPIDHINLRYTQSSDVILEDVEIPVEDVVGGEAGWNRGWRMLAGPALDVEKIEITAVTYGIARATRRCATPWWRPARSCRRVATCCTTPPGSPSRVVPARWRPPWRSSSWPRPRWRSDSPASR